MPEAPARANYTKQLDACGTGRAKGGCECMAAAIHEAKDKIPRNLEHEILACKYYSPTLVLYRLSCGVEIYLCYHR